MLKIKVIKFGYTVSDIGGTLAFPLKIKHGIGMLKNICLYFRLCLLQYNTIGPRVRNDNIRFSLSLQDIPHGPPCLTPI